MKTKLVAVSCVIVLFLVSCQSATPLPTSVPSPTPAGPMETQAAMTISADQTSTAAAKQSPFQAALTADALTAAVRTPVVTFEVSIPASACWMKSKVSVLKGQKVTISASGTVNTYGGRDGSSSEPDGQKSICGAIECPVQGVGYGALIGRLGEDGKPFFVGTNFELVATRDGDLYFTVNDWTCQDNSGAFDLKVTVE